MSQYGMQMPGGQVRRAPSMNIYTGVLFMAVVALAAACVTMFIAASKVGVDGNPFSIQPQPKGTKSEIRFGK